MMSVLSVSTSGSGRFCVTQRLVLSCVVLCCLVLSVCQPRVAVGRGAPCPPWGRATRSRLCWSASRPGRAAPPARAETKRRMSSPWGGRRWQRTTARFDLFTILKCSLNTVVFPNLFHCKGPLFILRHGPPFDSFFFKYLSILNNLQ